MTTEVGRRGQFDVMVGDQVVASRQGGLIAKLTNRPWPSEKDVVEAVRAAVSD